MTHATPAASRDALYRTLFEIHPEPTFTLTAEGALLEANRAFVRFVGRPAAALLGRPLAELLIGTSRDRARHALDRLGRGGAQSWEGEFVGPDGTVSVAYVTLAPLLVDGVMLGAHGVARDLTVYRVMEEQLQARVFVDPLTGLANRTQMIEAIERAQRRTPLAGSITVLHVDVDDFKLVNDGLGNATGDRLLVTLGERLRNATRGQDVVARLGGDEFAVLLDDLASTDDVAPVVARIAAAVSAPLELGGRTLVVTTSVGVAHWDGAATAGELLRHADLAMYRAKTLGKGRHVVFDTRLQEAAHERLELASALRAAIAAGDVVPAFQPIVDLATGRVVKSEALARWRHPTRGAISPAVFVPLAEEMGLVEELGALMLVRACEQLRAWAHDADEAVRARGVAVNVSGIQIERGSIVSEVRTALAATGVEPSCVTLELTESVAMRNPSHVLDVLGQLTALGVRLAIDDFGTGYSSLAYLHRFPVDVLKIDKSFVDRLDADGTGEAIVRTMLSIAQSLGLRTVAEGVETTTQRDRLLALGCDMGQGYLFGRPELLR